MKALGGCGSTLLARLLGAVPGTFVLSEVNPRSAYLYSYRLNPLTQVRDWRPKLSAELTGFDPTELGDCRRFGDFIQMLHRLLAQRAETLIVRDYSYVDYIGKPYFDQAPTNSSLRAALGHHFELSEVLLVRHPVDQLASLLRHPAVKNVVDPSNFLDAYESFLADHSTSMILRYEDIVCNPLGALRRLCSHWNLSFTEDALPDFSGVPATGFRGTDPETTICFPSRTKRHFDLARRFRRDDRYWFLLELLGYEDVLAPKIPIYLSNSIACFFRSRISRLAA
ncbi:MAG: sulfotransferase [Methyloceanibacter sp.]